MFCKRTCIGQWQGLRGIMLDNWSEEKMLSAQMAVAEIITTTLARCEIQPQGATPKLGRCSLNVDTFREIIGVVSPGVQYSQQLQAEHQPAWFKVGGANKFARRLRIYGEGGLWSTGLAAYEHWLRCGQD